MKLPLGSVLAFLIGLLSLQAQITPSLGAWEKTYGVDKYQHPMRIIVAEYDRLIAVSYNKVEDSDTLDLWLTKIDDEGKQMWERSIGQLESDMINQFFYVPDEGYYISGSTVDYFYQKEDTFHIRMMDRKIVEMFMAKLDEEGEMMWKKNYEVDTTNLYNKVTFQTHDGFVSAYSYVKKEDIREQYGYSQMYIKKIDFDGNVVWKKDFTDKNRAPHTIQETPTGDLLITGTHLDFDKEPTEFWVSLLDKEGNQYWTKTYEMIGRETFSKVINCGEEEFALLGTEIKTLPGPEKKKRSDIVLYRLNKHGEILWRQTIGEGNRSEKGTDIVETWDGRFVVLGRVNTKDAYSDEIWFGVTDEKGELIYDQTRGIHVDSYADQMILLEDDGVIIYGSRTDGFKKRKTGIWLKKIAEDLLFTKFTIK